MAQSTFESLPPFPSELPTAPIADISYAKLLVGDPNEGQRVLDACRTYGFFYLDLSSDPSGLALIDEAEQLLELSKRSFSCRSPEEAKKWHLQKGISMFGYKSAGTVKNTDRDLRPDMTEFWNISKDHMHDITPSRDYPPEIVEAKPLLAAFTRDAHECGMLVLRTLATSLGLPPETFVELNTFRKPAGDHARLTHKFPHASDSNAVGLPSHTDFGSVTVLFNWLGGLQIQLPAAVAAASSENGTGRGPREWVWVKPLAGRAVINMGDAMMKFTNGELKSAKHRVVPSPGEQAGVDRYSVVYFVRPCDESLMKPVCGFDRGQPVKVGGKVSLDDDENTVYTAGEWMRKRAIQMGS